MTSRSEAEGNVAILPVIDLRHGQVVHGVAGQRESYRPVESCLVTGSAPGQIAEAFVRRFGFADVYVADLDAICDDRADVVSLREIAAAGLQVWLDAGIGSLSAWKGRREGYGDWWAKRWIVGLESLESWREWDRLVAELGPERLVFSLDLERGVPKSGRPDFRHREAYELACEAISRGGERLLLLDLAAVGGGGGVATDPLLQQLAAEFPDVGLITGGGIRTTADIARQRELGAERVLVASALHSGQISPNFT